MSVSRSSSGGFSNAATRTLFSLSMEVPAYTRYSVPLKVETYSRGYEGPSGSQIGSYVYSMGTDPEAVPRTYYTLSNSPAQFKFAGSHKSGWMTTTSVSDTQQRIFHFDNLTGKTKTVTYYFYAGTCSLRFNRNTCYGTVAYARLTMTGAPSMQRLVPTSYDVEYDQLRHSLEEEYYEAIRLDENYPTRQIPCVSFQLFSGPLYVLNSEKAKLLNIIFYFNVTTVTPLSPSPYLPRRNDSTRRCPCKRRWTAERSFPVPIPCTMRT